MKNSNELINQITNNKLSNTSATQTTSETFNQHEKDATAYFYLKLRSIYGRKFTTMFPEAADIAKSQREWASRIGELSREQIDEGFVEVKNLMISGDDDFQWPEIAAIIGMLNGEYIPKKPFQHQSKAYVSFKDQDKNALPHLPMARSEALKKLKAGNPFKNL